MEERDDSEHLIGEKFHCYQPILYNWCKHTGPKHKTVIDSVRIAWNFQIGQKGFCNFWVSVFCFYLVVCWFKLGESVFRSEYTVPCNILYCYYIVIFLIDFNKYTNQSAC